jgi:hypothetical protein
LHDPLSGFPTTLPNLFLFVISSALIFYIS